MRGRSVVLVLGVLTVVYCMTTLWVARENGSLRRAAVKSVRVVAAAEPAFPLPHIAPLPAEYRPFPLVAAESVQCSLDPDRGSRLPPHRVERAPDTLVFPVVRKRTMVDLVSQWGAWEGEGAREGGGGRVDRISLDRIFGIQLVRKDIDLGGAFLHCCLVDMEDEGMYHYGFWTVGCMGIGVDVQTTYSGDLWGALVHPREEDMTNQAIRARVSEARKKGEVLPAVEVGKTYLKGWSTGLVVGASMEFRKESARCGGGLAAKGKDVRGTLVVMSDPYTGTYWHDFHNLFLRTFGTLYEMGDSSVFVCSLVWPEMCRVRTEEFDVVVGGTNLGGPSGAAVNFLHKLADNVYSLSAPSSACYDRVVIGTATSLDLNTGARMTIKTARLIQYAAGWLYYGMTGRVLDEGLLRAAQDAGVEPGKDAVGVDVLDLARTHDPRDAVSILFLARPQNDNKRRHFRLPDLEALVEDLRGEGLDVDWFMFEEVELADAIARIRAATVIVAVSGAGMTNLIWARPDTVIVYVYAVKNWAPLNLEKLTPKILYVSLARARGCPIVVVKDSHPATDPEGVPLPIVVYKEIIWGALHLGINAHLDAHLDPPERTQESPQEFYHVSVM